MLGIRYMKAVPTTFVLHYSNGAVKRAGPGLSFFYYAPTSTIVAVPLASADVLFVFNEYTADFQPVTLQGQLTYRVTDAKKVGELLNFSVDARGKYQSEDPELLKQRLVQTTQILARAVTQRMSLSEALVGVDTIIAEVLNGLRGAEAIAMLGVEVLGLAIVSIKPTPEMSKALEADARERLQRRADEAIYARRNAAVEQERVIKESELNTELAVEDKKRQIREAQMAADISVEQQRAALISQRTENDRKTADARAYALDATLKPLRDLDWRTLMAVSGKTDAKTSIAMAFQDLASNAGKVGELNITPDLLKSLLE